METVWRARLVLRIARGRGHAAGSSGVSQVHKGCVGHQAGKCELHFLDLSGKAKNIHTGTAGFHIIFQYFTSLHQVPPFNKREQEEGTEPSTGGWERSRWRSWSRWRSGCRSLATSSRRPCCLVTSTSFTHKDRAKLNPLSCALAFKRHAQA